MKSGHIRNPGVKPAIFAFRKSSSKRLVQLRQLGKVSLTRSFISSHRSSGQLESLKKRVRDSGRVKIYEGYDSAEEGVALVHEKLLHMINIVSPTFH